MVALIANTLISNSTCSGSMDGSVTITPTGGTTADGNYTFAWSDMGTVVAAVFNDTCGNNIQLVEEK